MSIRKCCKGSSPRVHALWAYVGPLQVTTGPKVVSRMPSYFGGTVSGTISIGDDRAITMTIAKKP